MSDRFSQGVDAWSADLGLVRNHVRQELVLRQLSSHLVGGRQFSILDAGCGQGTLAIELARLGHRVVGLDQSTKLLGLAETALADEENAVRQRMTLIEGDLLHLAKEHRGGYDVVCCHGVVMYLPSLDEAVTALARCLQPGGLISILTRNRAGIAMRAGMTGDWASAVAGFDARFYDNRLGISDVRADEPVDVQAALASRGATVVAWYGVRLFTDHYPAMRPPADIDALLAAEEEAGRRDPYRSLAALTHTLARVPVNVTPPSGDLGAARRSC